VFVNGWTLEAAIEVCANGELLATEVEDLLIQLATKSLIVAEYKDSQLDRYKMLETIRECARKKLADQSVAIEKRMVEYYIQYAAQHQRNYLSLEQEWDNLFTSMRWVYQQKQWQSVIEFSQALTEAWFARGRYAEARQGYQWAYEGVELLGNRLVMAEMLYLQARSYSRQRNYLLAAPLAQEALDIQKQENDQQGSVLTLHLLANITLYGSRDFILAEQYCQQALALCEKLKDQGRQAEVLYVLAQVHSQQDDFRSAQKYAEESLRIFRLLNRRPAQATVLDYLILVYRGLGDYTSAQQVGEASLELFQQLGNEWATIQVLRDQGKLLKDMGQIEQACSKWTEALSIAKRLPDHPLTSELQTLLNTHCA
jgi:tetratricopeptide (TPR) repeat protein